MSRRAAAGVLAAAAALVIAAPAAAREAEAFGRMPAPRATTGPDGAPRLAIDLGRGAVLEARAEAGDLDRSRHEVRVKGRVVGGWPMAWGDASRTLVAFRMGDEVLVGTRVATSMGMGVEAWSLAAFRLRGEAPVGPPLRFFATDWGPDAVRADARGMAVLATDWLSPTHGRGRASLHLAGAWFGLADGRLVPRGPWVARPYLFGFERERGAAAGAAPTRWLRAGKAAPYPGGDPRLGPTSARLLSGTLAAGPDRTLTLGGRRLWLAEDVAPAGTVPVMHVVERGVVYPPQYVPADLGPWVGRKAEVRRYGDRAVLELR